MTFTLETLKADHADIYEQVKEEGRGEARQEADTIKEQAHQGGKDHVIALVEAVLGEEAKNSIDQVMQAGLTAEQVKVSKDLFGKVQAQADPEPKDDDTRQQILDGIENKTSSPVAPAGQVAEPQSFEAAVEAYMNEHGCTKGKAIKAVSAKYPELHRAWIDKTNK